MSDVQTFIPTPLVFTSNAARKVYELISEEGNLALKLRVFITGGGCSGFQYGFAFEEDIADDDTVIEKRVNMHFDADVDDGSGGDPGEKGEERSSEGEGGGTGSNTVKLLVDPMSFTYLTGAEIDHKEDLDGARFIIRNPNAQTTCGCGSSFSV